MKALILSLLLLSFFSHAETETKVTLPLAEYMRLKEATEAPNFTVIENVEISGEYGKNLRISVRGASSGKAELVNFMDLPRGSVYDCKGNAIVQKSNDSIMLLSQGSRYSLDCTLSFPNWNEANFTLINVLHQSTKISGGESILSGDTSRQSVILTRTASAIENNRAEVTAVGHHRLTVLPEETRFEYNFQLSNPGRSKKNFSVPLHNGEMIQTVSSESEYKDLESSVEFSLNPGINSVSVKGRFKGDHFKVPIPSAQNFLVIENSPMLQLNISTKARRVSVQDTGMYSQYSTSRAYLLSSNEDVNWAVKKLEVFASTGYSVNAARYTVYVPRKGAGIIEAGFEFNNQGTPEIAMKVPGRVTYVEVSGIPQVLLRDPAGALLLQVPTGIQQVLVQYEGSSSGNYLGQFLKNDLARPDAVMSDVSLSLRLSDKWDIIWGRGLFESRTDLHMSDIVWGIFFSLLMVFLLKKIGLSKREVTLAGISSFFVFTFLKGIGAVFVALMVMFFIYKNRSKLVVHWPKKTWMQFGVVILGTLFLFFVFTKTQDVSQGLMESKMGSANFASQSYEGAVGAAAPQVMLKGRGHSESEIMMDAATMPSPGSVGSAQTVEADYKGLPARIKIPNEGRVLTFTQGMIDKETEAQLKILLINAGLGSIFLLLGLIGLGWVLYSHYRKLWDYVRA